MANVIASNVLTPGLALAVDLVSGDAAVGGAVRRACVIAVRHVTNATGVADTVYQAVAGADAAGLLLGPGVPGHLAIKRIFEEYKLALVDVVPIVEPAAGVAASGTLTFAATTPVTVTQTVTSRIAGRTVITYWAPGATAVTAATDHVAAVNALDADMPVVAANGAGTLAVLTMTFKIKGTHGNDCKISSSLSNGAGGSVTASGAALAGGTAEAVLTGALAAIAGTKYSLILFAGGNTDLVAATTTGGAGVIKTHIANLNSGFGAKLQQAVFGITGTVAAAKAMPAQHNAGFFEAVHFRNALSLGCEFAGAEVGARLREEAIDPNVNRTNRLDMPYRATLYPPLSITTDRLTAAEMEDALQSGLSAGDYTNLNECVVKIPRTTYWKDTTGNPDHRLVYVSQTTTLYDIGDDLAAFLPARFPDAKLSPDLAEGDDELPPKVVEAGTVDAVILNRAADYVRLGWILRSALDAAVEDGTWRVVVDSINPSKLNMQLPFTIIPPLTQWDLRILGS